jgi:hypothetical protein
MYQSLSQEELYQGIAEPDPTSIKSGSVDIVSLGSYNKIVVDGKEVVVVSPAVIDGINRQHQQLRQQIADLHLRHQRLMQQHTNLAKLVVRLEKELENKVNYD